MKPVGDGLDLLVVMDPIESIKPGKDSSFAMMLEAQRRGQLLADGDAGRIDRAASIASSTASSLTARRNAARAIGPNAA